ncbi:hypothetical protein K431DRAFT_283210 [Polychaeton citri CBS 116435]|uniref:DUF6594 domain-containing protein n=1 Tax=Polychaeton citri CBS 116435 TaxID=1314669 RepID=A0A9P4Q9F0_9PEZI|nr:hypothetical protein K431DRAFT_283210 [Polychaeton citri CBS 116435]
MCAYNLDSYFTPDDVQKYQNLGDQEKREDAWKYYGYPKLAEWMSSSTDTFLLRRFSKLSARTLLMLQHELAIKEREIAEYDEWTWMLPREHFRSSNNSLEYERETNSPREALLLETIPMLKQYYDLINAFAGIKQHPTATGQQMRNFANWEHNYPEAIRKDERHFDRNQGDVFPVTSKPKAPLRALIEQSRLIRFFFAIPAKEGRASEPGLSYFSNTGLDIFASIFVLVAGLALLFGPMWWLNFVQDDVKRLWIITGFVTAFTSWLWCAAGPRPFEILAATAAYAAVLMVFMQSNG